MQPKVSELLTIDLYGTFTASKCDFAMIRSDFNLPLKLIPTVVGGMREFAQPGLSSLQFCTLPLASRDRRNQGLGAHRDGGARHPRARQPRARGPGGAARSRRLRPGARGAVNAQHPARLAAHTQRTSCARRKSRRPPKHLLLSAPAALLCGFAGVAAGRSARRLAEVAAEIDSCSRIRARADSAGGLILAARGAIPIFEDFFRPPFSFFFSSAAVVLQHVDGCGGAPQQVSSVLAGCKVKALEPLRCGIVIL